MESTDKLRSYIRAFVTGSMETDLTDLADEIEQEIAERYMELPVDADGEPIHLGFNIAERVSYEQASAVWNSRAERTCKRVDTNGYGDSLCSKCYGIIELNDNYCPNCGAKVVGE